MSRQVYASRDSPPSHTLLDQKLDPRVPRVSRQTSQCRYQNVQISMDVLDQIFADSLVRGRIKYDRLNLWQRRFWEV